jgi:hypothetical protein
LTDSLACLASSLIQLLRQEPLWSKKSLRFTSLWTAVQSKKVAKVQWRVVSCMVGLPLPAIRARLNTSIILNPPLPRTAEPLVTWPPGFYLYCSVWPRFSQAPPMHLRCRIKCFALFPWETSHLCIPVVHMSSYHQTASHILPVIDVGHLR